MHEALGRKDGETGGLEGGKAGRMDGGGGRVAPSTHERGNTSVRVKREIEAANKSKEKQKESKF